VAAPDAGRGPGRDADGAGRVSRRPGRTPWAGAGRLPPKSTGRRPRGGGRDRAADRLRGRCGRPWEGAGAGCATAALGTGRRAPPTYPPIGGSCAGNGGFFTRIAVRACQRGHSRPGISGYGARFSSGNGRATGLRRPPPAQWGWQGPSAPPVVRLTARKAPVIRDPTFGGSDHGTFMGTPGLSVMGAVLQPGCPALGTVQVPPPLGGPCAAFITASARFRMPFGVFC
jgi:hypothetical protein